MESKAPFVESLGTHRRDGARVDWHGSRRFEGFASDHFEFGDVRDIFNRDRVAGVLPEEERKSFSVSRQAQGRWRFAHDEPTGHSCERVRPDQTTKDRKAGSQDVDRSDMVAIERQR